MSVHARLQFEQIVVNILHTKHLGLVAKAVFKLVIIQNGVWDNTADKKHINHITL